MNTPNMAPMQAPSVLDRALSVADQGYPVFPCRSQAVGIKGQRDYRSPKSPLTAAGFKDASTDPAAIRAMPWPDDALIGVPTGARSGIDVLDLDPRNGSAEWQAAHGKNLPIGQMHTTRGGGQHYLYQHRPGQRCSTEGIAPGVDVKADGGYVIWWPECGGVAYCDDEGIPEWPAAVLAQLDARGGGPGKAKRTEPLTAAEAASKAPPSEAAVVRLLDAMENPLSVGRDLYAAVMHAAADCALITGDPDGNIRHAAVCWAEKWEGRATYNEGEKWDDDWSKDPVKGGWPALLHYGRKLAPTVAAELTEAAAAAEFGALPIPTQREQPAPAAKPHKLFTSRSFKLDLDAPYLVKHLLAPGNICALLGQPGAGKSTLAPWLAFNIAHGRPVFGMRTRPARTLYVAAEDYRGVTKRIGALGLRLGHTDDCAVVESGNLRDADQAAALLATIADYKPDLVIIDTLAAAWAGMDENTSQDMGQVVEFIKRIARCGPGVMVVHHPAKADESGTATARGHGCLNGALDMTITLKADDVTDGNTVVRGLTPKNRNGTTARDLAFRKEVVTLGTDVDGDPITTTLPIEVAGAEAAKPPKVTDMQQAFLAALPAEGATEAEWIEAGMPLSGAAKPADRARVVRDWHAKLVAKGLIRVDAGRSYAVSASGVEGSRSDRTKPLSLLNRITSDQSGSTGSIRPEASDGSDQPLRVIRSDPHPLIPQYEPLAEAEIEAQAAELAALLGPGVPAIEAVP